MILVDASIWVDYFRQGHARLGALLDAQQVLTHPFVIGEVSLGNLPNRLVTLADLRDLPSVATATDKEVSDFIERERLYGLGSGYVDAHLLAATLLSPGAALWTRDVRLAGAADRLGLLAP